MITIYGVSTRWRGREEVKPRRHQNRRENRDWNHTDPVECVVFWVCPSPHHITSSHHSPVNSTIACLPACLLNSGDWRLIVEQPASSSDFLSAIRSRVVPLINPLSWCATDVVRKYIIIDSTQRLKEPNACDGDEEIKRNYI